MSNPRGRERGGFALRPEAWLLAQCLLLCALVLLPAGARAAGEPRADQILGRWLTEKREGIIDISVAADGTYQGKIIGGDSPNRTDSANPDPARRSALLLGQAILWQLKYKGQGQWSDGQIYDPNSGRTYHCIVEMLGADQINVRGFIGVSLLGRNQVWTRYQGSSLTLPPAKH